MAEQGEAYLAALTGPFRKRHGIWFTPPDLALAMAREALRMVLIGRAGRKASAGGLRILDPACGAGIFLAAVREAIGPVAAELGLAEPPALDLVGCDIDSGALEVARRVIADVTWIEGDALLGEGRAEGALTDFDLVITNPPYVRADGGPDVAAYRERISRSGRFESLAMKWDLAAAFVERGLQACRPGGLAVFLLPDTYRKAAYARTQHIWLASRHAIRRIEYFEGLRAFDASVGSMALYVERSEGETPDGTNPGSRCRSKVKRGAKEELRPGRGETDPGAFFGWEASSVPPGLVPLERLAFISYGLRASSDEKRWPGEFVTADLVREAPDREHPRAYAEGKDLGGFRVLRTRYLEWGTERAPARFTRRSFPEFLDARPKILALCISGREVRAALDPDGHAFNHTAVGIVPWRALAGVQNAQIARASRGIDPARAPEVDLRYLLAILCSRQTRAFLDRTRRSDKHIYPDDWRAVGVPLCGPDLQARIAEAIDLARSLPFPSREFESAVARVQSLVDAAYAEAARR